MPGPREVSNTALQALTVLNDAVFVEAAQSLAAGLAQRTTSIPERVDELFVRCLGRPPGADERALIATFYQAQYDRLAKQELDAAAIAGSAGGDLTARAPGLLRPAP